MSSYKEEMSGIVDNLTPEEVAKAGQPILFYNDFQKQWLFVNTDLSHPRGNVLTSQPYKNETRNQFVLQQVSKNEYKIYNPEHKEWVYVSDYKYCPTYHYVNLHSFENKACNVFRFEKVDNGKYFIYNPSYDQYICVDDIGLPLQRRGDRVILSRPPRFRDDKRNMFSLELLHNAKVESVSFDINEQETVQTTPKVISSVMINNDSTLEQNTTFSVNESISETCHFQHTAGVSLTVGTEFKVGIPFISDGKLDISVNTNYNHTWGTSTTTKRDFKMDFPLRVPPNTNVQAKAIIQEALLEVPYKMSLTTGDGNYLYSYGTWKGVSHWDLKWNISESPQRL